MSKAIYPGTFDPVTLGHLDVIRRAARVFDELIVAVGNNPSKRTCFSLRSRLAMVRKETAGLKNVSACSFSGLVTDFAHAQGVSVLIRGVRTVTDFEYELQMAIANRAGGAVETVFMAPTPEHEFISARLIKEIAAMGGNVSKLVTPAVERALKQKFKSKGGRA